MKDQLYSSFVSYVEYARPHLNYPAVAKADADKKIRIVHVDKSSWIRSVIEQVEASKEFKKLVSDFSTVFKDSPRGKPEERLKIPSRHGHFYIPARYREVQNFFRRSGLYLKISEAKPVDVDDFFEQLWSILSGKRVKTMSLQLLEGVRFSETVVDFRGFKIQRFSREELDDVVENTLNHIFYPDAELDTRKLSHYWFVVQEDPKKTLIRGSLKDLAFRVRAEFPNRPIQLLALFDWKPWFKSSSEKIQEDVGWQGFSIPFSITISDYLFASPHPSPDLSGLEFFPVRYENGTAIEEPEYNVHLKQDEVNQLRDVVVKFQCFLENIDLQQCKWEFLEVAMGYLAKAFLTEGLEQLLWHITVLEALLGERDEVLNSIRRRLAIILGEGDAERIQELHKTINELYSFRSDLVHGRRFKKAIYRGHLRRARDLSRKTLLWFLTLCSFLHDALSKDSVTIDEYPRQKDVLALIDYHLPCLGREGHPIDLPTNFPNIRIWGD
jgi:hypothetical protein